MNVTNKKLIAKIIAKNRNLKAPSNFGQLTTYLPSPRAIIDNNYQDHWQENGRNQIIEMTEWEFIPIKHLQD